VLAATACAASPAAGALTFTSQGAELLVRSDAGADTLTLTIGTRSELGPDLVTRIDVGVLQFTLANPFTFVTIVGRPDCRSFGGVVTCLRDPGERVSIELGGGGDRFTATGFPDPLSLGGDSGEDVIRGGDGDDDIDGGPGDDVIRGGDGDDDIDGGSGDDFVLGGDGDDALQGGFDDDDVQGGDGVDTVRGGPGDDHVVGQLAGAPTGTAPELVEVATGLERRTSGKRSLSLILTSPDTGAPPLRFPRFPGQPLRDQADLVDGGTGTDATSYAGSTRPVEITLDGLPNDGAAGENDDVRGVEIIGTGFGNDRVIAQDGSPDLVVFTHEGRDRVSLGDGDDIIDPGPGIDTVTAGGGRDGILARDGEQDLRLNCGAGDDLIEADLQDALVPSPFGIVGCEVAAQAPAREPMPAVLGRPRRAPQATAAGTVPVELFCGPRARPRCVGRVSVTLPGARAEVAVGYAIPRRRRAVIQVPLPADVRSALRTRRAPVAVVATAVEAGRLGPRTSRVTFPIRSR